MLRIFVIPHTHDRHDRALSRVPTKWSLSRENLSDRQARFFISQWKTIKGNWDGRITVYARNYAENTKQIGPDITDLSLKEDRIYST